MPGHRNLRNPSEIQICTPPRREPLFHHVKRDDRGPFRRGRLSQVGGVLVGAVEAFAGGFAFPREFELDEHASLLGAGGWACEAAYWTFRSRGGVGQRRVCDTKTER